MGEERSNEKNATNWIAKDGNLVGYVRPWKPKYRLAVII